MRRPPRRRSEDPSEPAVVPATLHLPACTGPHVPQAAAVTGAVGTGRGRPWSPKICHTVGLIGDLARQTHARADTVVPTLECATSMPDFCTPLENTSGRSQSGLRPSQPHVFTHTNPRRAIYGNPSLYSFDVKPPARQ